MRSSEISWIASRIRVGSCVGGKTLGPGEFAVHRAQGACEGERVGVDVRAEREPADSAVHARETVQLLEDAVDLPRHAIQGVRYLPTH